MTPQPIPMTLNIVQTSQDPRFTQLRQGVAIQDLGLCAASGGFFSARRVRAAGDWHPAAIAGDAMAWFSLLYVVEGSITLRLADGDVSLREDDAVCQATLSAATVVDASPTLDFIEILALDVPQVRALIPARPQPLVALDGPDQHEIGTGPRDFFDYRDLGVAAITKRQIEVQVIRARRARTGGTGWHSHTMAQLSYGLSGWASLGVEGRDQPVIQKPGDAFSIPPDWVHNADAFSDDYWALQLQIPADYATQPKPEPRQPARQPQGPMMPEKLLTLQESLASVARGDPVFQAWEAYRGLFKWSGEAAGSHRLEYPALEASLANLRLIMVPTGQSAPPRTRDVDTVYQCFEGSIEVTIGEDRYVLNALDLLSVPAGSRYSYSNCELSNALICEVSARNEGPAAQASGAKPIHMVWAEYRRDFKWTLPLAEQWGYHRGSGPLIITDGLRGHTVRMPTGQTTPWHHAARDMLFIGIHHEVEFRAGGRSFTLGPRDKLIVPAGTPYCYTNHGLQEVVFLSIGGKLPPGRKGTYYAQDPGWPVNPATPTIEVFVDQYGDAKVVDKSAAKA